MQKTTGLTGNQLKLIAMAAMTLAVVTLNKKKFSV